MRVPAPHSSSGRKLIHYYQTHFKNDKFVPIFPLVQSGLDLTHVIVAAFHLNEPAGNITLNDDPYLAPRNDMVWQEARALQNAGIKVLGMLGGASQGSFRALDGDTVSFNAYYGPLREMVVRTGLQGLDLDVEEEMSLAGIIRLIDRLKSDFGPDFIITLAPVVTALQNKKHLSGFDYEQLEKAFGNRIAWYNTQFYCGWGSMYTTDDYEEVLARGWHPEKVVVGLVTNPKLCQGWVPDSILQRTLGTLIARYPDFAGVAGWEYAESITVASPDEGRPSCWAELMTDILRSSSPSQEAIAMTSHEEI